MGRLQPGRNIVKRRFSESLSSADYADFFACMRAVCACQSPLKEICVICGSLLLFSSTMTDVLILTLSICTSGQSVRIVAERSGQYSTLNPYSLCGTQVEKRKSAAERLSSFTDSPHGVRSRQKFSDMQLGQKGYECHVISPSTAAPLRRSRPLPTK